MGNEAEYSLGAKAYSMIDYCVWTIQWGIPWQSTMKKASMHHIPRGEIEAYDVIVNGKTIPVHDRKLAQHAWNAGLHQEVTTWVWASLDIETRALAEQIAKVIFED